ncbi:MAG TPA: PilN domain-containing protein [Gaiellaceae bacterium]|nr:PilN domain-containing protein [Gaiellaceae bacterium]
MRAVNLLPADAKQRKSFQGPGLIVIGTVVLAAVVLGTLGMSYLSASNSVADAKTQLAGVQAQIAAVPPATRRPVSAADQQLASDRSTRVQALNAALTGRIAWDRVLRQVTLVLPSDVWLTDLTGAAPVAPPPVAPSTTATSSSSSSSTTTTPSTPAPAPTTPAAAGSSTPGTFTISGYTYSQESVARLLARLAAVPSLSNVNLQSSVAQDMGNQTVFQFHINASVKSGGGA